jgi:membrane fusion protein, multidrug efflux system
VHTHASSTRATIALVLLVATAGLAGCQEPAAPPPPAEVSRPALVLEIASTAATSGLRFPGRVRAVQRAELAFNVPGQVIEFPAREGQRLAAGELIARLDPANFATRLAAARAEFEKPASASSSPASAACAKA